nr:uncharacterized protein LOC108006957 [Drosophila suzukii]
MSGQKHLRLRYYTSLEEALVVKLWREHLPDIPSYTDNLPIFREIAFGLQQHGIRLNKQEVRRRINSYRNRYLNERSRLEGNPGAQSDWRLYSLIDCLFRPARAAKDVFHAHNVLEEAAAKARAQLPALPPLHLTSSAQVKFERDADGCAFLDPQPLLRSVVKTEAQQDTYHQVKTETEYKPTEVKLGLVGTTAESATRRAPLTPANHQSPPDAEDPPHVGHTNGQPEAERSASKRKRGRRSILPRTGQITMAAVEGLRKENKMLQEQNDAYLLALEQKEKQFLVIEQNFMACMKRQKDLLALIQQKGFKQELDRNF